MKQESEGVKTIVKSADVKINFGATAKGSNLLIFRS
jgi:hypothetical protein